MARLEGLEIIDAEKPLVLTITPKDVTSRGRKKPNSCAAAMAVRRELHTEARVHLSRIYVKQDNCWVRYEMPQNLRIEIISFDRGGDFDCGDYLIPPLRPSARTGARQGSQRDQSRKSKTRRPIHRTANVRIDAQVSGREKRKSS